MTMGKTELKSQGRPTAQRRRKKEETAAELYTADPYGLRSLQNLAGNRAVSQQLRSSGVSLRAGSALISCDVPGDRYEEEARRCAEQVVRMPQPSGKIDSTKSDIRPIRDSNATAPVLDLGPGAPLPSLVTELMESGFERDFSAVRIHTGTPAARLARRLQAQAFTTGNHIAFDHGAFDTQTRNGRELLAHELSHVVQQSSAVSAGTSGGPPLVQRTPSTPSNGGITVPWRGTIEKSLQPFILILLARGENTTEADATRATEIARRIVGNPATFFELGGKNVVKKTFEEAVASKDQGLVLENSVIAAIAREVGSTTEVVRATALAMNLVLPAEEALAEIDPANPPPPVVVKPLLLELAKAEDDEAFAVRLGQESDLPGKLDSLGPDNKRGVINLARKHGLVESTTLVPPPPGIKVRPPDTLVFTVGGRRLLQPLDGLDDLLMDVNVAAWQGYAERYNAHAENYVKQVSTRDWFSIRDQLGPIEVPEKSSDTEIRDAAGLDILDKVFINASQAPTNRIFQLAGVPVPGATGFEASLTVSVENEGTGVSVGIKGGKKLEGEAFLGAEAGVKIDPSFGEGSEELEFKAEGEVTESGTSGKIVGGAKAGPVKGEFESGSSEPKVGAEKNLELPGELPFTLGAESKGTELPFKTGVDPLAVEVSSDPSKGVVGAGISAKKEIKAGTATAAIEGKLGFKAKLIALGSEFETNLIATAIDPSRPSIFEEPKGGVLKQTAKFKEGIPWGQLSDDERLTNVVRHNWTQQRWDKKLAERKKTKQGGKP